MKWKTTKNEAVNEVKSDEVKASRQYYFSHHVSYKGTHYEPNKVYELDFETSVALVQYLLCKDKYPVINWDCGCKKK